VGRHLGLRSGRRTADCLGSFTVLIEESGAVIKNRVLRS